MLSSIQHAEPYVKNAAEAIAAGKPAKAPNPVSITAYRVNYARGGAALVLTDKPGVFPPLYALGVGNNCPPQLPPALYNKTYTAANNTVHTTGCSFVLPYVEEGPPVKITHYVALCRGGTDLRAEVVEEEYGGFTLRTIIVDC
ncbi:MAG: hypothetical protein QXW94_05050 [Desulfurococcaceae archaeon]